MIRETSLFNFNLQYARAIAIYNLTYTTQFLNGESRSGTNKFQEERITI